MKTKLLEHMSKKDIVHRGYKIRISIKFRLIIKSKIIRNEMMKTIKAKLKSLLEQIQGH